MKIIDMGIMHDEKKFHSINNQLTVMLTIGKNALKCTRMNRYSNEY